MSGPIVSGAVVRCSVVLDRALAEHLKCRRIGNRVERAGGQFASDNLRMDVVRALARRADASGRLRQNGFHILLSAPARLVL